jgi:LysM repeat protein
VPAGTSAALGGVRSGKDHRPPGPTKVHVVRSGDTVSAIARRYGAAVADVLRWNNLGSDHVLRPGDRLVVADLRVSAVRGGPPTVR